MPQAVIIQAVRTPIGRHGGILKDVRPDDLAALVIKEVLNRARVEPALVEEVYLGCANQAGEDNRNVARMAVLLAGFPESVAAVTFNRLCASGLTAINAAARAIKAGEGEVYIAGAHNLDNKQLGDAMRRVLLRQNPHTYWGVLKNMIWYRAGMLEQAHPMITGFLRLSALVWALGVSGNRIADAYNTANTTPNIIYELALGGILSSVIVPVFVEWLQKRGRDEAEDVGRRLFSIALAVLSTIMVLGIIFAPWIVKLYASGIGDPARKAYIETLGPFLLRFFMPQIVFYGIGAVATAMLNAHRRFAAPMFAPILNNLTVVGTCVAYGLMAGSSRGQPGFGPTLAEKLVLAIGTTLGVVAMTAALWPAMRRTGFRFRFRFRGNRQHEAVRRIGHLAKWVVIYVVVNTFVDLAYGLADPRIRRA